AVLAIHFRRARIDAELEATVVEVQSAVQPRFLHLGLLFEGPDAQHLRAELAGGEIGIFGAVRVRHRVRQRGVEGARHDRQTVVESELLTEGARARVVRAVGAGEAEERGTGAVHGGIVRQALALRVMSVQPQGEVIRYPPGGIEPDRIQLVLLLVALLLEAEVLAADQIAYEYRRRHRLARVEGE